MDLLDGQLPRIGGEPAPVHKNQSGQRHDKASLDAVRAKPNSKARHLGRVEAFAKNTTPSFETLVYRLFQDNGVGAPGMSGVTA